MFNYAMDAGFTIKSNNGITVNIHTIISNASLCN